MGVAVRTHYEDGVQCILPQPTSVLLLPVGWLLPCLDLKRDLLPFAVSQERDLQPKLAAPA